MLAGCDLVPGPSGSAFGAHYAIETPPAPTIVGNVLRVTVNYSGCQPEHVFELHFGLRSPSEGEIWLRKVTEDEPCDMLIIRAKEFDLPAPLQQAGTITLLSPSGSFRVR